MAKAPYKLKAGAKLTAAIERFLAFERPEVVFAVRGMDLTAAAKARLIIDGVKAHILMIQVGRLVDTDELAEHINSVSAEELAQYIIEGATLAMARKEEKSS